MGWPVSRRGRVRRSLGRGRRQGDIVRRGHPTGFLAADRLYDNCEPGRFQLPARALGYDPVYEYREDQLGIQDSAHGAHLVDGSWYCPSMPVILISATKDFYGGSIDADTWRQRIAARVLTVTEGGDDLGVFCR